MAIIDDTLRKAIVDFLVTFPTLQSEDGRRAVLLSAGLEMVIPQIEMRGSTFEWTQRVIAQLDRYGTLPGHTSAAVFCFLEAAEELVGIEGRQTLAVFQQRLTDQRRLVETCPYRGLFTFREEDERFFFGRDQYLQQLLAAVQRKPLVAVVGASGSGKSSLLSAGLLPALRRQGNWLIAPFRPRHHPFHELAAALLPLWESTLDKIDRTEKIEKLTAKLMAGDLRVAGIINSLMNEHPARKLLLFVDQFEELYTLGRDDQTRHYFLDELLQNCEVSKTAPVTLVLSLRADFLGKALAYRPFADAFQNADLVIGPMNRAELRTAIEEPAKIIGAKIEDGLTDRILDAVGDEPGNLPLLEFTLTELWTRQTNGVLSHAAYDDIGGVQHALAAYAEQVYTNLTTDEQARAQRIFVQLIRPGENTDATRRVATRAEVGAENWALVCTLADARLVVTGGNQATRETVEIVHEALMQSWPRFQAWIATAREFRRWQERLRAAMQAWEQAGHHQDLLLPDVQLAAAEISIRERQYEPTPQESAYLAASRVRCEQKRQEQERRREQRQIIHRQQRDRKWGIVTNMLVGVCALLIILQLQDTGWLQFPQNAIMDAVTRIFGAATISGRQPLPPLVLLDVDEATYRAWGEPLVARDRILQLVQAAVEARARLILVDFLFVTTTFEAGRDDRRELHPHDQALYDYLAQYSAQCRAEQTASAQTTCSQILLLRGVRTSDASTDCLESRPSFLDDAVKQSPDVQWGVGLAYKERDQFVRRVALWQQVCSPAGEFQALPALPLSGAALLLQPDHAPETIVRDLQNALRPVAPLGCFERPGEIPLRLGGESALRTFSECQHRILYTIPWTKLSAPGIQRLPAQGIQVTKIPANVLTRAIDHAQAPDRTLLQGSIVMLGSSFAEAKDMYRTPLGAMPGSVILLNTLVSLMQYGELRSLPVIAKILFDLLVIGGMSVAWMQFYRFRGSLAVSLLTDLVVILLGIGLYVQHFWVELDVIVPLIIVQGWQLLAEFRRASELHAIKEEEV